MNKHKTTRFEASAEYHITLQVNRAHPNYPYTLETCWLGELYNGQKVLGDSFREIKENLDTTRGQELK